MKVGENGGEGWHNMVEYELVVRDGKPYLRKKFYRGIDISPNRLQHIINFSEAAHSGYGLSYEEFIQHVRNSVKPVGRKVKERIIEMSTSNFIRLLLEFQRRGIVPKLPPNYKIIFERPVVKVKIPEKPLEALEVIL